jgi:UDP-sugar pyrophosphorylase
MRATLEELGQGHLFAQWSKDGGSDAEANEARFFEQIEALDASYPGGLKAYVANARQLLADSKSGVNPLEGWTPKVPTGTSLRFGSEEYLEHEQVGVEELDGCAFVLVAGGLGERLGFSGIKVALPYQISTGDCYLQLYIRSILALQRRAAEATGKPVVLPLAIMLSEDTYALTEQLLKANGYFGMLESQVTLLKQEKVPCLGDNDARLSADPDDPYRLLTKPHGHGDVRSP